MASRPGISLPRRLLAPPEQRGARTGVGVMHKTLRCFGALRSTALGALCGAVFGTTTATAMARTITDGSICLIPRDTILDSFDSARPGTLLLES